MSQSLLKAIKILDCFDGNRDLSLMNLVEISGLPKTTVYRLVSSLEQAGLLVKIKRSGLDVKYRMGLKFLELGNKVSEQLEYRKIALPYMRTLNNELNELVYLAVIEGDEAVYVEQLNSTKPVRLVIKVGRRSPLYAGSAPKLLLAFMGSDDIEEYLKDLDMEKFTDNTIYDKQKLKDELKLIRERGYSISQAERFEETMGFSYPVRDYSGKVIASLGVSIPVTDYSPEREKVILENIKKSAEHVSVELGYVQDLQG
ncbi:IclR family transcriptional regulator [Lentibacillus jeotgali]|uniref:IclR family transcriptional regulator n=1 Tax=Lentibacillus jeotgali TaxID=558169 RepID=UPI0002628BBD|nr:IclR family transcriptional regulator [Lentibacillus jeotgali]